MLLSKLLGERYKEKPADAFLASHIFMLRADTSNGSQTDILPASAGCKGSKKNRTDHSGRDGCHRRAGGIVSGGSACRAVAGIRPL